MIYCIKSIFDKKLTRLEILAKNHIVFLMVWPLFLKLWVLNIDDIEIMIIAWCAKYRTQSTMKCVQYNGRQDPGNFEILGKQVIACVVY